MQGNSLNPFNEQEFQAHFDSESFGFNQELEISAPIETVFKWVDPHQAKQLHPLIINIEFEDTGSVNVWKFRVTDRLKMLGITFNVTYTTEALIIREEEDITILYQVDQPPGVKLYEIWHLKSLGAGKCILSEKVKIQAKGIMRILKGYIYKQAFESHQELFKNIKEHAELTSKDLKV